MPYKGSVVAGIIRRRLEGDLSSDRLAAMTRVTALCFLPVISIVAVSLFATPAHAQYINWQGDQSSDWFVPGNWSTDAVPADGDRVVINTVANNPAVVEGNENDAATGEIRVGDNGTGELILRDSGTLYSDNLVVVGHSAAGDGRIVVTGQASSLTAVALYVGLEGAGELVIETNGTVRSSYGYVGHIENTGHVLVSGKGSAWEIDNGLIIGQAGTGEVSVADGGTLLAGVEPGEVPVVLDVGGVGDGTLTVRNGGTLNNNGAARLAFLDTGSGTALVTGAGSTWTNTGDLTVGEEGTGNLTIRNGGMVSNAAGRLGLTAAAEGRVTVSGAGAAWNNGGETGLLVVGIEGTGQLIIQQGGSVSSGYGRIVGWGDLQDHANPVSGTGSATITGAGSSWSVRNTLWVGADGDSGQLRIADGGEVKSGVGVIGRRAGTSGAEVLVTGANSVWKNTAELIIGEEGSGSLTIENGAKVSNSSGLVALSAGSTSDVLIAGDGSAWMNRASVTVGFRGAGELTVTDAGTVSAAGGAGTVDVATLSSSSGTVNIGAAVGAAPMSPGTLSAATVRFGAGNGALVFNHTGTDYTFEATLAGNGALRHLTGTTSLIADSGDFTGAITVEGGTLRVDGTSGSGKVSVLASGSLGGTGTIGGAVDVSEGNLVGVSGATLGMGSLTLGERAVVAARLGAPSTAALFDVAGDLTLDGTLDVSDAGGFGQGVYRLMSYGGTLIDNGLAIGTTPAGVDAADLTVQTAEPQQINLTVEAGQTLQFWDGEAAGNADNGAINGGAGTWSAAAATWTDADGASNGAMDPTPGFAIFQAAPGTVTVDVSGGAAVTGMQFASDGYVVKGDPIALAGVDPVLRVGDGTEGGAEFTATIDADLQGTSSVRKTDLGTLVLNGTNTWDTTTVEAGMLVIGGTLSGALQIAAGGLLGGSGTLGSVDNAGTVAPGDSIGTLTVTGDYIHRADATFLAEIEPGGTSDLLDVGGTATLEGGQVEVIKLPGQYAGGTRYTLIDADGGVSGTFDELVQDMPFLDLGLAYDPNHVYLDVTRSAADFGIVCAEGTANQCEVAGALDAISTGGTVTPELQAAMTEVTGLDPAGAQAAFDRLSGEVHASLTGLLLEGHALHGESMTRRLAQRREADRNGSGLGSWVRGYGQDSELGGDGTAHGADVELYGAAVGVDSWLSESWLLGLSFNAMRLDADTQPGDHGEAESQNVALYTSVQGERAYLDGVLSYASWDNEISRVIELGGIERHARAKYGGNRLTTYLEAGYRFEMGEGQQLQPLVSVQYDEVDQDDFRERGAGDLNLIGLGHSTHRVTTGLGVRWSRQLVGDRWTVEPNVEARWLRLSKDRYAELDVAFEGAPAEVFRVRGVSLPRNRGVLSIGVSASNGEHLELFADFNYQDGNNGYEAHQLAAGLRWRW